MKTISITPEKKFQNLEKYIDKNSGIYFMELIFSPFFVWRSKKGTLRLVGICVQGRIVQRFCVYNTASEAMKPRSLCY